MRNPLFIVLTILGALCACACIVLIAVIILNGDSRSNEGTADAAMPVPERFKQLTDTMVTIPDSVGDSTPQPAAYQPPAPPRYTGTLPCEDMVTADTLKQLLTRRNLFCQKSQWSKQWARPSGKGIRLRQEGLAFADSIVTDSLTHRIWQRYSTYHTLNYRDIDAAIAELNTSAWQGYRDWRVPTIEELMVLLTPGKNRYGLHLPGPWNSGARDFWSCNTATDSVSIKWNWVVRTGFGRCNYGHPNMPRALLAVREY